jgi:hypothetical protein
MAASPTIPLNPQTPRGARRVQMINEQLQKWSFQEEQIQKVLHQIAKKLCTDMATHQDCWLQAHGPSGKTLPGGFMIFSDYGPEQQEIEVRFIPDTRLLVLTACQEEFLYEVRIERVPCSGPVNMRHTGLVNPLPL